MYQKSLNSYIFLHKCVFEYNGISSKTDIILKQLSQLTLQEPFVASGYYLRAPLDNFV